MKKNNDKQQDRIAELENNWKRALADYRNLEKRVVEEKEAIIKFANSILILKLLPTLDNLELTFEHDKNKGTEMIIKEFKKTLQEEGVEEIEVKGKKFDPELMEAVEGEGNIVQDVLRKGYFLNEKVLRPTRVKVGKGKKK